MNRTSSQRPGQANALLNPIILGIGKPYMDAGLLRTPPLAPSAYTFLLQALARVGRSIEGDEWAEWETATIHYPHPGSAPSKLTVETFLKSERGPLPPRPVSLASGSSNRDYAAETAAYRESKAKWEADAPARLNAAEEKLEAVRRARADLIANSLKHAPGVAALHGAFRDLSERILDEQVPAFGRLRSGGEVFPLKPEVFADEDLANRVIREGVLTVSGAQAFIFVDRKKLERAYPLPPAPVSESEFANLHLSDSMLLALDVIREWEISPAKQYTVEAIASQVRAIGVLKGLAISERRSKDIARIVRDGTGET